jgi:serine protease AprX
LPTGVRLDADPRYTGKGVTICFIDSGFYPHPDLTEYKIRIKEKIEIRSNKSLSQIPSASTQPPSKGAESESAAWHGTMTSVVCAGDGYLSKGLYKGIASDGELVLLQISNVPSLGANLPKALQWILDHHREYNIRIVNISLGADDAGSYKQSETDQLCEDLIKQGVTIVAAVGNDEYGRVKPPANAPNVIAVGGLDDENKLDDPSPKLYHSTFGKTEDDLAKPELIAPAIWIAAPILPETKEQREAALLYEVMQTPGEELHTCLEKLKGELPTLNSILHTGDAEQIKDSIRRRIQQCKCISPHYMHVDGTSFAAPIVCGVIAQMLEINPSLTPAMIRSLLFSTAKRVPGFPADRQGFGRIQPYKAILKCLNKSTMAQPEKTPIINRNQQTISFTMQHDCASRVSLAGSFNHWDQDILLLEPVRNGEWKIDIPMLPAGRYSYKFLVDEDTWVEDITNPYREPDGFSGFNSILIIKN